ncbi:MAG: hypothetical protein OXM55_06795 [Bdellovibrionales bacterium]|nr:hypothetical protein [Bdellovibrionales bacterium]
MKEHLQQLSYNQAFKKGADLWVLSDPKHNFWNYKIDWYLGFQIKKQKLYRTDQKTTPSENLSFPLEEKKKQPENPVLAKAGIKDQTDIKINPLLSTKIKSLLKKYQITSLPSSSPSTSPPLLIESSLYLPNLWTLEVAYSTKWLDTIYDIWCSLNQPTLRIFAPKEVKKEAIEKKWQSVAENTRIQYIIDYTEPISL